MAENFPNLGKEAIRSRKHSCKQDEPRETHSKRKVKDRGILEGSMQKITPEGNPMILSSDSSSATFWVSRERQDLFKKFFISLNGFC